MADLEELAAAYGELRRVADHVLLCLPGKDSLVAWLPMHHLWVQEVGGGMLKVEERGGLKRKGFLTADAALAFPRER